MSKATDQTGTTEEIIWRRFGRNHEKPCRRPSVLTCAMWECQKANACQDGIRQPDIQTDPDLLRMLYLKAAVTMTEAEVREQRISWVIGQTGATRAQVEAAIND